MQQCSNLIFLLHFRIYLNSLQNMPQVKLDFTATKVGF